MFDIASSELLVVAIVALLVVGPKDLPKLMRTVGQWVRRARMMTGQLRAGFDQMMQEAEFQEERERIMKMYPNPTPEAPTPEATPQAAATPTPQYNEAVQTFSAAGQASGAPEPTASHVVDESAGQAVEDHRPSADQAGADQTGAGQVGASEHRS